MKKFLLPVLVAALTTGCAFSTARVNMQYQPVAGSKSPLSELKPITIALQVEDKRDPAYSDRLGDKRNGFGQVTASIQPNGSVTEGVRNALKAELENSGHKVVAPGAAADSAITVQLKRYWCETTLHFWDVEVVGTLNADVNVQEPPLTRSVTGVNRKSFQAVLDSDFEKVLNGALAEFVREFTLDSRLASALARKSVAAP
jgi:hypothetical protein